MLVYVSIIYYHLQRVLLRSVLYISLVCGHVCGWTILITLIKWEGLSTVSDSIAWLEHIRVKEDSKKSMSMHILWLCSALITDVTDCFKFL